MSKCRKQYARAYRAVFKWVVSLIVWGAWRMDQAHAGDETVTGNLTVNGDSSSTGTIFLGTPATISNAGLAINYTDGTTLTPSGSDQISFTSARPTSSWYWCYTTTSGGGTALPQMWLDNTNTLTLYDRSANTPGIQLNPNSSGSSYFTGSLTMKGTTNLMPYQTLSGPTSVLTAQLGDVRYVQNGSGGIAVGTAFHTVSNYYYYPNGAKWVTSSGSGYAGSPGYGTGSGYYQYGAEVSTAVATPTIALPTGSASGTYSFAGIHATASGQYSVALGTHSTASGGESTASGYDSTASGQGSIAIGYRSTASGGDAIASGSSSTASGTKSVASGSGSNASGYGAVASGYGSNASGQYSASAGHVTSASGYDQFTIGQYNAPQASPAASATTWVTTDDLFQIGNGTSPTSLSNAFAVKKNGTTSVFGNQLNFGLVGGQTPGTDASTATHLKYVDGTAGAVTFSAAKPNTTWSWQNNDTATAKPQMKLDGNNVLTIYDSSGSAAIVLDPAHPIDTSTVLTESVANGLYVQNGSAGIVIGNASGSVFGSPITGPAMALPTGSASAYSFAGIHAYASGPFSIALGYDSSASGQYSTATGVFSTATGSNATALSYMSTASGNYAVAAGVFSTASGSYSFASGKSSTASGGGDIAIGQGSTASGGQSFASGAYSTASGGGSIASGGGSTASGLDSTASGFYSTASGKYSTAAGRKTTSSGFGQYVIGQYNAPQASPAASATTWVATDDLFQIGNGTGPTSLSNALTVKKNGNTTINGTLTVTGALAATYVPPTGDLSMGSFTAGP